MTNEICCSNSRSIFPSFMKKNALLEANNGVFIYFFFYFHLYRYHFFMCVDFFIYYYYFFFGRGITL